MALDVILRVVGPVYQRELDRAHRLTTAFDGFDRVASDVLGRAEAVVTSGTVGVSEQEMDMMPRLRLISTIGTGYENVDIAAASARGIGVTHAAGANAPAVAEHAIGLLLSVVRAIPAHHDVLKAGQWRGDLTPRPMMTGKRLGIFGLGEIGARIGRIAEAFGMTVAYTSRTAKPALPWQFHRRLRDLAAGVDFLIVTAPGGKETFHAVDLDVLQALGPQGYLVSIGRGTVVDTAALIRALYDGIIAGAAVDVYETEPEVPVALREAPNVVLTPHIGGVSSDVQIISARLILRNLAALETGAPLASPVPEFIAQ